MVIAQPYDTHDSRSKPRRTRDEGPTSG
jgi:hypothetical protein